MEKDLTRHVVRFSSTSRSGYSRWAYGYPDWAHCGAKVCMSRSKSANRLPVLILQSPVCVVGLCVGLSTLLKKCCSENAGPSLKYTDVWRNLVASALGQSSLHTHTHTHTQRPSTPSLQLKHLLDIYITLLLPKQQSLHPLLHCHLPLMESLTVEITHKYMNTATDAISNW